MENETNTADAGAPAPELVRPIEGRMIAGVAMGLSNRFDVPDWVIRVAFFLTLFAGGLGLVLYLACWALIRSEDEAEPPASRFFDDARTPQSWIGIGLIFLAVLLLLDNLTFLSKGVIWAGALMAVGILLYTGRIPAPRSSRSESRVERPDLQEDVDTATKPPPAPPRSRPAPPPRAPRPPRERSVLGRLTLGAVMLSLGILALLDLLPGVPVSPEPRHYLALATTVIGIGLLVGSVWGRARWLLLIGVVLVPTLLLSPLATGAWRAFEAHHPVSFEELQPTYRFEVGTIVLDLASLPWDGQSVAIQVSGEVGRIRIYLPHDVSVSGNASVEVGSIRVPGQHYQWGVGNRVVDFSQPGLSLDDTEAIPNAGHVDIRASIEVGSIHMTHVYVERTPQP
jgi:phage shock protein PspC (stress-responsive transcriptional regulator)